MDRAFLRLNILLEATAVWARTSSFEALVSELPRIKWILEFERCSILLLPTPQSRARAFIVSSTGASLVDRAGLPPSDDRLLGDAAARRQPDGPENPTALTYPLESGSALIGAICFIAGDRPYDYQDYRFAQFVAEALAGILDRLLAREHERIESEGSRRKDEFLAMLGHELRNPLAPMVTAIELLKTHGADQRGSQILGILERQTSHMRRLIDDVLDISRIQRGGITVDRRRLDVADIVERAIEMASPAIERQRHRLSVDVPAQALYVDGDASRLIQILTNLLTNAAKYSDPERQITIAATAERGTVRMAVRDQGFGIDPAILPVLFQPFVQGNQDSARSTGGLGLGLSIAGALAAIHGGSLWATSAGAGLGSEFVLTLPAAAAVEPVNAVQEQSSFIQASPEFGTVLVVDDNRDAADLLSDGLRNYGYSVVTAYDAIAALAAARATPPAVALLDLGLPVMDGYDLARALRDLVSPATVRLVAITGYSQDRDRAAAHAVGFEAHLVKPIDLMHVHQLLIAESASGTAG
jgi:signal transduction histidine kinase/CheY-like chemotaxis protein